MNSCLDFSELISAYADNEINSADKQRLEGHISECAGCSSLLAMYREITVSAAQAAVPAPEALRAGVMERIARETDFYANGQYLRRKAIRASLARIIPIAACLAIVLLILPQFINTDRSNSDTLMPLLTQIMESRREAYDVSVNDGSTQAAGGSAGLFIQPDEFAPESLMIDSSFDADADTGAGGMFSEHDTIPTMIPPADEERFDPGDVREYNDDAVVPYDSSEVKTDDPDQPDSEWAAEPMESEHNPPLTTYFAVITIIGELPDSFMRVESSTEDGVLYISREEAQNLIKDHEHLIGELEYGDVTSETAKILTPTQ